MKVLKSLKTLIKRVGSLCGLSCLLRPVHHAEHFGVLWLHSLDAPPHHWHHGSPSGSPTRTLVSCPHPPRMLVFPLACCSQGYPHLILQGHGARPSEPPHVLAPPTCLNVAVSTFDLCLVCSLPHHSHATTVPLPVITGSPLRPIQYSSKVTPCDSGSHGSPEGDILGCPVPPGGSP